jgi:hypothetical protein
MRPKSGSHLTRRWREMDSNHRSLARASRFILRKVNCAGIDGAAKKIWRGTDGSNPFPSSDLQGASGIGAEAYPERPDDTYVPMVVGTCRQLTLNVAGLTLNFKKNLSLSL